MGDTLDSSISQLIGEVEKGPDTPWMKGAVKLLVPVCHVVLYHVGFAGQIGAGI